MLGPGRSRSHPTRGHARLKTATRSLPESLQPRRCGRCAVGGQALPGCGDLSCPRCRPGVGRTWRDALLLTVTSALRGRRGRRRRAVAAVFAGGGGGGRVGGGGSGEVGGRRGSGGGGGCRRNAHRAAGGGQPAAAAAAAAAVCGGGGAGSHRELHSMPALATPPSLLMWRQQLLNIQQGCLATGAAHTVCTSMGEA